MVCATDNQAIHSGQAALEVGMVFGESTVTSAASSSPMKLLTPVARGQSVWAYTSSFGGGLVAGDQTELRVTLAKGTRCFLSTQSSTKVYNNPHLRPCSHSTLATLAENSLLVFAPDPVQAFAGSHYRQRQQFHLARGAGLVMLDWFTSGRAARGERWAFSRYESRNDIFVDGQVLLVDPLLLQPPDLAERMGRFDCLATLVLIGAPLKDAVEALRASLAAQTVERCSAQMFSISPVQNGAVVRIAGMEVENVRRVLQRHLRFAGGMLGDDPWARKW